MQGVQHHAWSFVYHHYNGNQRQILEATVRRADRVGTAARTCRSYQSLRVHGWGYGSFHTQHNPSKHQDTLRCAYTPAFHVPVNCVCAPHRWFALQASVWQENPTHRQVTLMALSGCGLFATLICTETANCSCCRSHSMWYGLCGYRGKRQRGQSSTLISPPMSLL
jgi:hypothetical protein